MHMLPANPEAGLVTDSCFIFLTLSTSCSACRLLHTSLGKLAWPQPSVQPLRSFCSALL